MRSSLVAAASCALALFVVCAVVTHVPRSFDSEVHSLLSLGVSSEEAPLSSDQISSPVLVTSDRPQPTKQALLLRGGIKRSSLASVGNTVRFNSDASFNFGRRTVQASVGFTLVANFAFSDRAGLWERIYDFGPFWGGNGQGMGVLLARVGTSNTLTTHLYPGGGRPAISIDMGNQIRPNRQMTTASTYQCAPAGVRFVRIQARRAMLQLSFVSVQTADGTNVALSKRAYASGTYSGTAASKAVNGPAGPRRYPVLPLPMHSRPHLPHPWHPLHEQLRYVLFDFMDPAYNLTLLQNLWHATDRLDWWEVDLGREFAVTKVTSVALSRLCALLTF